MSEYARGVQIGVLTPQANTTVEPELWTLMPPGAVLLNARLTSEKDTIEARLVDYTTRFEETCGQFANAPVTALAAACTGASYLIGAEAERALVARIEAVRGVPFLTAALASVMALRHMGARRIALLSPYPEGLTLASLAYWESHGFEVTDCAGPALETAAFHPIYAMTGEGVAQAHARLSRSGAEAVLMLGTGMATLRPILRGRAAGLTPAVSCNLALVWAACQGRSWEALRAEGLEDWLAGAHWAERLRLMFPGD